MSNDKMTGLIRGGAGAPAVDNAKALVSRRSASVARLLPASWKEPERKAFLGLALEQLRRVKEMPEVLSTARGVASVEGALLTCAGLGLMPAVNGEFWFLPFKDHGERVIVGCVGYRGWQAMAYEHPRVAKLWAHVVYARDAFEHDEGMGLLRHQRCLDGDPGAVVAYYAAAKLTTGEVVFDVWGPWDAERAHRRSPGAGGRSSPWNHPEDYHKMALKCLVSRFVRSQLPIAPKASLAADRDERVVLARPGTDDEDVLVETYSPPLIEAATDDAPDDGPSAPARDDAQPEPTDPAVVEWLSKASAAQAAALWRSLGLTGLPPGSMPQRIKALAAECAEQSVGLAEAQARVEEEEVAE